MGAWGYLPFENDDALDWLDELESGGAEVIRKALAKAGDRYINAPDGAIALAAAEITSASHGNPLGDLPENVADWVTAHGAEITAEDVEQLRTIADYERFVAERAATTGGGVSRNPLKTLGCSASQAVTTDPVAW